MTKCWDEWGCDPTCAACAKNDKVLEDDIFPPAGFPFKKCHLGTKNPSSVVQRPLSQRANASFIGEVSQVNS
jgi:hypothetical protein